MVKGVYLTLLAGPVLPAPVAAADHAALVTAGGVPAVTILTVQQQKLQDLFNANAANFNAVQTALKTWWGIKPVAGGLNARAQDLHDIFGQLKSDLTPAAAYPYTSQLEKIVQAATDVSQVHPITGSPDQQRIDDLVAALTAQVTTYANALNALVTPTAAPTSAILLQLDALLLKPIRTETTPVDKHKLAVETVQNDDATKASVAAGLDLADILGVFPDLINQRRKSFADEAATVLRNFALLDSVTDVTIQNAWTQVKDVLNKAKTQATSAPFVFTTPLNVTMDAIGDDSSGLIQLVSGLSVPGDLNLARKLEDWPGS
jgi:hypothetical protein